MISNKLLDTIGVDGPYHKLIDSRRSEFQSLLSQTHMSERFALYLTTAFHYRGIGSVLDLGTAAGGSTYCLAAGLLDNKTAKKGIVYGYDLFKGYSVKAFNEKIEQKNLQFSTDLKLFDWQTKTVSKAVKRFAVNLNTDPQSICRHGNAEIVHIDTATSLSLWNNIFEQISKLIIPGHTIWIFQDFERARLPFQIYSIGELLKYGEIIGGASMGSVYFRFQKTPSKASVDKIVSDSFTLKQKISLTRKVLKSVKAEYVDIFPSLEYLKDIEKTMIAYIHLSDGNTDDAVKKFKSTTKDFRDHPANKIYSQEIII